MNPLKILFIIIGFILFGLAAIGAVLPVLPTTPLLLLSAFFFAKGSTRFNNWFLSTKLYQDYAESFLKHRTMTLKTKIMICSLATTMMLVSLVLVPVIWVKILLGLLIAFMLWYFVYRIKTVTPEEDAAIKASDMAERAARAQAPIPLNKTIEEVREIHEEIFEEASSKLTPQLAPSPVSSGKPSGTPSASASTTKDEPEA